MRRLLALLLVVAISACERAPDPVAPDPGPSAPAYSLDAVSQDPTPDQLAVAQAVPGFGGYFIDASGAPTVYLTDPAQRPAAEAAAGVEPGATDLIAAGGIQLAVGWEHKGP